MIFLIRSQVLSSTLSLYLFASLSLYSSPFFPQPNVRVYCNIPLCLNVVKATTLGSSSIKRLDKEAKSIMYVRILIKIYLFIVCRERSLSNESSLFSSSRLSFVSFAEQFLRNTTIRVCVCSCGIEWADIADSNSITFKSKRFSEWTHKWQRTTNKEWRS